MDDFENKLTELHDRVLSKALTEDEQNSYTESLFESIKHINEYGEEFWYARELQRALSFFQSFLFRCPHLLCRTTSNDLNLYKRDFSCISIIPVIVAVAKTPYKQRFWHVASRK